MHIEICASSCLFFLYHKKLITFIVGDNAYNRPTWQKGVFADGTGVYSSSKAVDGNTNLNGGAVSCAQTDGDTSQLGWWTVDLGSVQQIKNIYVWSNTGLYV